MSTLRGLSPVFAVCEMSHACRLRLPETMKLTLVGAAVARRGRTRSGRTAAGPPELPARAILMPESLGSFFFGNGARPPECENAPAAVCFAQKFCTRRDPSKLKLEL